MSIQKYPKYLEKGMKFGKLTILYLDDESTILNTPNTYKYVCQCECGNTKSIIKKSITGGASKSCGCGSTHNYHSRLNTGDKFGRLEVISLDSGDLSKNGGTSSSSSTKYTCKCECGNIVSVMKTHLEAGHTQSCGCLQKERASDASSKINPIEDCGDYIKIFFFNKDHGYTIIDKEDYDKVKDFCWYAIVYKNGNKYAVTNGSKSFPSVRRMHRFLLAPKEDEIVDHINGNGLDNRKDNIRKCTYAQNNMNHKVKSTNLSGTTGVSYKKDRDKWVARIWHDNIEYYLGQFPSKEEAIKKRIESEIQMYGSFAPIICREGIDNDNSR